MVLNSGKIIKWLGLVPLKKPNIKVALIPELHITTPINYDGWPEAKQCKKIGKHLN